MKLRLGSAPDSWGVWFASDPKQTPWKRYLDEVAKVGYTWTELGPYGYLPTDPARLRSELERRGLKVCGGVVMANLEEPAKWAELEQQVLASGELLSGSNAQFLVLIDGAYSDLFTGQRIEPERLDASAWKRLIDAVHRIANTVRGRFKVQLVFHPHADTHVQYEDQIEALLEETDPALVGLCLDTGHHAYRGGDPVSFMRHHHRRIPYLHLKSVDREKQKQVERQKLPFAKAVELGVFCEPSEGAVDFLALRTLLQEIDYEGFAIVEQDMYPAPLDKPFPIAQRTYHYLRSIGF